MSRSSEKIGSGQNVPVNKFVSDASAEPHNGAHLDSTENPVALGEQILLNDVEQTIDRGVEAIKTGDRESIQESARDLAANILFPNPESIEAELAKSPWMTENQMVGAGSDPENINFVLSTRAYFEFLQGSNRSEIFRNLDTNQREAELERFDTWAAISNVLDNMSPMPEESVRDFVIRAAEQALILRAASETQHTEFSTENLESNSSVHESVILIASNDLKEKRNPIINFAKKIAPKIGEIRALLLENMTEAKIAKMESELIALNNEYQKKGKLSYKQWQAAAKLEQFFEVNDLEYPLMMDDEGVIEVMPILGKVRFMQEVQSLNPARKKMSKETYLKLIESENIERVINYNEFLEKHVQFSPEFFEKNNVNSEYLAAKFDTVLKRMAVFAYDNRDMKTRAQIENYAVFVDQMLKESSLPEQQKLMLIMLSDAKILLYANPANLKRELSKVETHIQSSIGDRKDKDSFISSQLNRALFSGNDNLVQKNSTKLYGKVYTPTGYAGDHLLGEVLIARSPEAVITTEFLENFPKLGEIVSDTIIKSGVNSISEMLQKLKDDNGLAKEFLVNILGLKEFQTVARYMLGNNNQKLAYAYAESDENRENRKKPNKNEKLQELINMIDPQDVETLLNLAIGAAGIVAVVGGGIALAKSKESRIVLQEMWTKSFSRFWRQLKPNDPSFWAPLGQEYGLHPGYAEGVSILVERDEDNHTVLSEGTVIDVKNGNPVDQYGFGRIVKIDGKVIRYSPMGQLTSHIGDKIVTFWEGLEDTTQKVIRYFVEANKNDPHYGLGYYYEGGDNSRRKIYIDRITRRPIVPVFYKGTQIETLTQTVEINGRAQQFLLHEETFATKYIRSKGGNVQMVVTSIKENQTDPKTGQVSIKENSIDPLTGKIIDTSVSKNGFALPYINSYGQIDYKPVAWDSTSQEPILMAAEISEDSVLLVDPTKSYLVRLSPDKKSYDFVDNETRFTITSRSVGTNFIDTVVAPTGVVNMAQNLSAAYANLNTNLPLVLSDKSQISQISIAHSRTPATTQSNVTSSQLLREISGNGVLKQSTIVLIDPKTGLELDLRGNLNNSFEDLRTWYCTGYMDSETGFPVDPIDPEKRIVMRAMITDPNDSDYKTIFYKDTRVTSQDLKDGVGFILGSGTGDFAGYMYDPYAKEYVKYSRNAVSNRYKHEIQKRRFIDQSQIFIGDLQTRYSLSDEDINNLDTRFYSADQNEYKFEYRDPLHGDIGVRYVYDSINRCFLRVLSVDEFKQEVLPVRDNEIQKAVLGDLLKPSLAPIMYPGMAFVLRDPAYGVTSDKGLDEEKRNKTMLEPGFMYKAKHKPTERAEYQVLLDKGAIKEYSRQLIMSYTKTAKAYGKMMQLESESKSPNYIVLNSPASHPEKSDINKVEKAAALAMQNAKKVDSHGKRGVLGILEWSMGVTNRELGKDLILWTVLGNAGLVVAGGKRLYHIYRGRTMYGLVPNLLEREDTPDQLHTKGFKNTLGEILKFAIGDRKFELGDIALIVGLGSSFLYGLGIQLPVVKQVAEFVNQQGIKNVYRVGQFLVSSDKGQLGPLSFAISPPLSQETKDGIRASLIKDLIKDEKDKIAEQRKQDSQNIYNNLPSSNTDVLTGVTAGATLQGGNIGQNNTNTQPAVSGSQTPVVTEAVGSSIGIKQRQVVIRAQKDASNDPKYNKLSAEDKVNLEAGHIFNVFFDNYEVKPNELTDFEKTLPKGSKINLTSIFDTKTNKINRAALERAYSTATVEDKKYLDSIIKELILNGYNDSNYYLGIFFDKDGRISGSKYNFVGDMLEHILQSTGNEAELEKFLELISFGQ